MMARAMSREAGEIIENAMTKILCECSLAVATVSELRLEKRSFRVRCFQFNCARKCND